MPELPALVDDVRDRAVPPPFEEVTRRVRSSRRRATGGVVLATALLVGGVATWQSVASPSPHPVSPAKPPAPSPDEDWQRVVHGSDAQVFDAYGTDDGAMAVIWTASSHGQPTFALVIREANGTVHGSLLGGPMDLTPVPGGWVGVPWERFAKNDVAFDGGVFYGSDGLQIDLGPARRWRKIQPGDVFINWSTHYIYSPRYRTWSTPLEGYAIIPDGYITPEGELVGCYSDGIGSVSLSARESREFPSIPGAACVIAGRGDSIAAVGLGDSADGGIPLTGLMLSNDGGRTVQRGDYLELPGVTSIVITPAGSTLVTDASSRRSFVLTADRKQIYEPDQALGIAFVAGDTLFATSADSNALLVSHDDGHSWLETTLPGLDSSDPLIRAAPSADGASMAALIAGPLALNQGCATVNGYLTIWPSDAGWDADTGELVIPGSDSKVPLGGEVKGGGGYLDPEFFTHDHFASPEDFKRFQGCLAALDATEIAVVQEIATD